MPGRLRKGRHLGPLHARCSARGVTEYTPSSAALALPVLPLCFPKPTRGNLWTPRAGAGGQGVGYLQEAARPAGVHPGPQRQAWGLLGQGRGPRAHMVAAPQLNPRTAPKATATQLVSPWAAAGRGDPGAPDCQHHPRAVPRLRGACRRAAWGVLGGPQAPRRGAQQPPDPWRGVQRPPTPQAGCGACSAAASPPDRAWGVLGGPQAPRRGVGCARRPPGPQMGRGACSAAASPQDGA